MSKSVGNYILVRDLLKKHDPMAVRFFLINSHYRKNLDFNEDAFNQNQSLFNRIKDTLRLIEQTSGGNKNNLREEISTVEKEFIDVMDDDLNTVGAIQSILRFVRRINSSLDNEKTLLLKAKEKIIMLMNILGVKLEMLDLEKNNNELVAPLVDLLLDIREDLREVKMYPIADKIRANLAKLGVILEDKPEGTIWKF